MIIFHFVIYSTCARYEMLRYVKIALENTTKIDKKNKALTALFSYAKANSFTTFLSSFMT